MPAVWTLLVLLLPLLPEGVRHSNLELSADLLELRVFAATFNAANRVYDKSAEYASAIDTILPGHEDPGNEADIVFLGFQEYEDDKYVMANEIGASKLWKTQSKTNIIHLKQKANDLFIPPAEVNEASDILLNEVKSKHRVIESKFIEHRKEFGKSGHAFHKQLADTSPVNHLFNGAGPDLAEMNSNIQNRLKAYSSSNSEKNPNRYQNLSVATESLRHVVSMFPNEKEFNDQLKPIRAWNKNVKMQMQKLRANFPNLELEVAGEEAWTGFLNEFRDTIDKEFLPKSKLAHQKFQKGVNKFQTNIKKGIQQLEDGIASSIHSEWKLISDELTKLQKDINTFTENEEAHRRIVEEAHKSGQTEEETLTKIWKQWTTGNNDETSNLRSMPRFPMTEAHVRVQMEPQKFNSGYKCEMAKHYDTVLYAFVNPWSAWKITPKEYHSSTCLEREQKSQKNLGCNINNNDGGECGKVVNMQVFEACKKESCHRFCALNTHMSFAAKAEDRLNYIGNAMEETESAKCDAVVFVGDFNSRLHCGPPSKLPPFAHKGGGFQSSLQYLLTKLCKSNIIETCSLKNSPNVQQKWDELVQILDEDEIHCHEIQKKAFKKNGWKSMTTHNKVKKMGFREAEMPQFPPTYKLADVSEATENPPEWYRCNTIKDGEVCFANPDEKPKHNPAWTDRIIVKAHKFETVEYSRRPVTASFGTDHAAVVARLNIQFKPKPAK